MKCRGQEEELLLLYHGEVSGLRRWLLERHVYTCPRCQERLEEFSSVSALVAASIREPDLKTWIPPANSYAGTAPASIPQSRIVAALAVFALLISVLVLTNQVMSYFNFFPATIHTWKTTSPLGRDSNTANCEIPPVNELRPSNAKPLSAPKQVPLKEQK